MQAVLGRGGGSTWEGGARRQAGPTHSRAMQAAAYIWESVTLITQREENPAEKNVAGFTAASPDGPNSCSGIPPGAPQCKEMNQSGLWTLIWDLAWLASPKFQKGSDNSVG